MANAATREASTDDLSALATQAVERYGPEVCGYLAALTEDRELARELWADVMGELWQSLPGYRGDCSLRTWMYLLARRRLQRYFSNGVRHRGRPLSQVGDCSALVVRERSATAPFLRTDVKDRVRHLRSKLTREEQELLILRIDRRLSWRDIALIEAPVALADAPKALDRRCAQLRKQFERTKARLRRLAERSELLGG
ncbi:MAG: sigma-70 family RNA polymerase sigma factor [Deltaproteobacteria bacterium]|nr:sigma-70 family RNA polymerase sigma factor [Deltaproteobacteria bacterium]